MSERLIVAIPARFASTRLPGKPLRQLAGRPMILHVIERARALGADQLVVATDDDRIARAVQGQGVEVCFTSPQHATGSDRLAECARRLQWNPRDIIVNLQGDEPLMPVACLKAVVAALRADPGAAAATLHAPLESIEQLFDPNCVKVVVDLRGRALYFSRAPMPWARDELAQQRERLPNGPYRRHVGLYAYRAETLSRMAQWPQSPLEKLESLEQLRLLENGQAMAVAAAPEAIPAGVDTEADLARVDALMRGRPLKAVETPALRTGVRSLLFVCMGNICRSPLSEAYARKLASSHPRLAGLRIESRGTHAYHRGSPADVRAQALGRAQQVDVGSHRAKMLEASDFEQFDLILAHDERNLADMRDRAPAHCEHKLRLLLDFAPETGHREVPDPYAGDHHDFIMAYRLIVAGVDGLVQTLERQPGS